MSNTFLFRYTKDLLDDILEIIECIMDIFII